MSRNTPLTDAERQAELDAVLAQLDTPPPDAATPTVTLDLSMLDGIKPVPKTASQSSTPDTKKDPPRSPEKNVTAAAHAAPKSPRTSPANSNDVSFAHKHTKALVMGALVGAVGVIGTMATNSIQKETTDKTREWIRSEGINAVNSLNNTAFHLERMSDADIVARTEELDSGLERSPLTDFQIVTIAPLDYLFYKRDEGDSLPSFGKAGDIVTTPTGSEITLLGNSDHCVRIRGTNIIAVAHNEGITSVVIRVDNGFEFADMNRHLITELDTVVLRFDERNQLLGTYQMLWANREHNYARGELVPMKVVDNQSNQFRAAAYTIIDKLAPIKDRIKIKPEEVSHLLAQEGTPVTGDVNLGTVELLQVRKKNVSVAGFMNGFKIDLSKGKVPQLLGDFLDANGATPHVAQRDAHGKSTTTVQKIKLRHAKRDTQQKHGEKHQRRYADEFVYLGLGNAKPFAYYRVPKDGTLGAGLVHDLQMLSQGSTATLQPYIINQTDLSSKGVTAGIKVADFVKELQD